MNDRELFLNLVAAAQHIGAYKATVIEAKMLPFDGVFRDMCISNVCGMFGKCYMCPPDVGDVETLKDEVGKYCFALVYQTVTKIEDSFDFEGMIEARQQMQQMAQNLRVAFRDAGIHTTLHLGVGGCGVCEVCAKRTGERCRFPDQALASLEAYCINVSELAKRADMKYTNGPNTITYFGAVLFADDGEANE